MGKAWRVFPPVMLAAALLLMPDLTAAAPFQCEELTQVISCLCEGKVENNIVDNQRIVINCRNLNISQVPAILGSSDAVIYELTLAQNNIQNLPANVFDGLRIQRLDLRDNRLNTIDVNAFKGLERDLKELYLGADVGSSLQPPTESLVNHTLLDTLHLEHFSFPNNQLKEEIGLNRLSALTSLTLKNNGITFIFSGSIPTSLTSLTLDIENLPSLPIDALRSFPNLETLKITHTYVSTVSFKAFELNTRLKTLDLGYNRINVLDSGCFTGITASLQHLSLRNNPVNTVSVLSEIKELSALKSLKLSEIGLTTVPAESDFLKNKASLAEFHLEGNSITTLGSRAFADVGGQLLTLNLARNQLASLDEQSFAGLSALTSLDLSHQTLPPGPGLSLPSSLVSLTTLNSLVLSSTRLDPTDLWSRIGALPALQTLHMDSTELQSIPDFAFSSLTRLTNLHLDNNALTDITQEMMAGPRGLKKLTLNNNQIQTVSSCTFHEFSLSPALDLQLIGNPLKCDCKLDWLLTYVDDGKVRLGGPEMCDSPPDKQGFFVSNFKPGDFTCASPQTDTCLELYTTPPPATTSEPPQLSINVTDFTSETISVSWDANNFQDIKYFRVRYMVLETAFIYLTLEIDKADRNYVVKSLEPQTAYSVCIIAYSSDSQTMSCLEKTTASTSAPSNKNTGDEGSSDTGVIVGAVIGAVVLLVILAAIAYLVFMRKRPVKKDRPVQPHTFAPSELPSMGAQTKQFTRPKTHQPKVGRALDEIQVKVISDGQTGGKAVSPTDRHSAGSYQFLDQQHPNPNPDIAPRDGGTYANDVGARPLPSAPQDSMKGYYNNGFANDKPSTSQPHYQQIDL